MCLERRIISLVLELRVWRVFAVGECERCILLWDGLRVSHHFAARGTDSSQASSWGQEVHL